MKINIVAAQVITQKGMFSRGDILSAPPYDEAFLLHLVNDAGAAVIVKAPENKMNTDYEPLKKSLSTQSLPPAKASQKPIAKKRGRPRKSSL